MARPDEARQDLGQFRLPTIYDDTRWRSAYASFDLAVLDWRFVGCPYPHAVTGLFSMVGAFRLEDKEIGVPLGVEAEIPLAPALILFGPNDSGKTNTMRLLSMVLSGSTHIIPRDRFRQERATNRGTLSVRLDLFEPAHRHLLFEAAHHGLGYRERPWFALESGGPFQDSDAMSLRLRGHAIDEVGEEDQGEDEGGDDEEREGGEEGDDEELDLEESLINSLRDALRQVVGDAAQTPTDTDVVVDRLVRSLAIGFSIRGTWLQLDDAASPATLGLDAKVCERVRSSIGTWFVSRGAFLPEIVGVRE